MNHIVYEELLMRGLLSNRTPAPRKESTAGKEAAQPAPAPRTGEAPQAE